MIALVEQSANLRYRAADNFGNGPNQALHLRFVASYITGSHAYKAGVTHSHGYEGRDTNDGGQPLSYRFNNGIPNQITQRALPIFTKVNVDHSLGAFVQDKWTVRRLTTSYGLRYDYFATSFPEQTLGPTTLTPDRDLRFPARKNLAWHDASPRLGASYDVFGTGRTAAKISLNVPGHTAGGAARRSQTRAGGDSTVLASSYEEVVSKNMLVYQVPLDRYSDTYNGHPLWYVALASGQSYLSLHLMPLYGDKGLARRLADGFRAAGKKLDMGKACIRFKTTDDLAFDVIGRIVATIPPDRWVQIAQAARRR
jgi:hypothetical protein